MRAGSSIRGVVAVLGACVALLGVAGAAHATGNVEIDELSHSSQNVNVADPTTRRLVLEVAHPTFTNHYGGHAKSGPDGFLYAGTGDGGSGGDPNGNARNL